MSDLTYVQSEIKSNPVWYLAWTLSEIMNDGAPIGWSKYIWAAECLIKSDALKNSLISAAPAPPAAALPGDVRAVVEAMADAGIALHNAIDADDSILGFDSLLNAWRIAFTEYQRTLDTLAAHPAQELRDNTNDLIVQRIRHILDLQGDADIVDVLKKRLGIDEH